MPTLFALTSSASGAARGHTYDAAMAFLTTMDELAGGPKGSVTLDRIDAAVAALGIGVHIEASAQARVASAGSLVVVRDVEVLGFAEVAKVINRPRPVFDTQAAFDKLNGRAK